MRLIQRLIHSFWENLREAPLLRVRSENSGGVVTGPAESGNPLKAERFEAVGVANSFAPPVVDGNRWVYEDTVSGRIHYRVSPKEVILAKITPSGSTFYLFAEGYTSIQVLTLGAAKSLAESRVG